MTSFATIAGALPAGLAFGPGAESLRPMSLAVVGGVLVSTFFTLLVVPAIYSLISPNDRHSGEIK
jgi:HAE1 family hydrophobic/amphiphilic exporter-1